MHAHSDKAPVSTQQVKRSPCIFVKDNRQSNKQCPGDRDPAAHHQQDIRQQADVQNCLQDSYRRIFSSSNVFPPAEIQILVNQKQCKKCNAQYLVRQFAQALSIH